jgi:hypothetical protein
MLACFEDAGTKTESQYLKRFYCSIYSKNLKKCCHRTLFGENTALE